MTQLAYLTACHTIVGDEKGPNDASRVGDASRWVLFCHWTVSDAHHDQRRLVFPVCVCSLSFPCCTCCYLICYRIFQTRAREKRINTLGALLHVLCSLAAILWQHLVRYNIALAPCPFVCATKHWRICHPTIIDDYTGSTISHNSEETTQNIQDFEDDVSLSCLT